MSEPTKAKPARKMPSTICDYCKKEIRLRPAGGDWLNDLYPIAHKNKHGARCEGSIHSIENKQIIEPKATP